MEERFIQLKLDVTSARVRAGNGGVIMMSFGRKKTALGLSLSFRRKILIRLALLSLVASLISISCQSPALQTRDIASHGLSDVAYNFDAQKVGDAKNSFHFMRSFVDYFYLLIVKNQNQLSTVSQFKNLGGWCAGDAHPENFGFLQQKNGSVIFTINDMDDAGPCPVAYDLYRLMVSSQLYTQKADIKTILRAYRTGLAAQAYTMPPAVSDFHDEALKKGRVVNPKKVSGNQLVRDSDSEEVDAATKTALQQTVASRFAGLKMLDVYRTAKTAGGSGGMTRYEVLLSDGNNLVQVELKEQGTPAISSVVVGALPAMAQRLAQTIQFEQGPSAFSFYGYVKFQSLDMLTRPILWGNVGVDLAKNSKSDNRDIIYYEAYTLGTLHRKSVSDLDKYINLLQSTQASDWSDDVDAMASQMDRKYNSLAN